MREKQTESILMKVTPSLKNIIDKKANELQIGVATYCRMIIQKEINRLNENENEDK